uniref:Endoglucanase Cel12A (Fragments) n=1 Tax=Gloeophyllum trabeum TaxID=104355 RepID=GUNB_GLOTR|nr:RecName: Full=Endoglucanase Cel12A; AltName: Full=Cellulase; AltName: Full=Endo-1,4-beta-glucanase [Gloeophyllum trabeum]
GVQISQISSFPTTADVSYDFNITNALGGIQPVGSLK